MNIKNNKRNKFILIAVMLLIIASILSCYPISANEKFYNKTIAKITSITEVNSKIEDMNGKEEQIKKQNIKAIIMNGVHKGKEIQLQNTTSYSQVNDLNLKVNDEVFISIQENENKGIISSKILDLKRDKYIAYITILFMSLILLIGGLKGFRSLASVIINIVIFSIIIQMFLHGFNLMLISIIASILFAILSISIVCGVNKKMISAAIATFAGTFISMLVAVAVIKLNNWNGVHFEEMEFLTHPPEQIFIIEILIGTLGAIMDIAISISSSINEIYDKNPDIEKNVLINSGREIGKDIMGTMANTLVFAYISGSIPVILLLLRNGYPISFIININLSLEIIRALTGSIGIVLSIPIAIYISVMLLKKRRIGEV
ncbi:YibE/F family protein [Clostridium thailandense]|uniref:YibE/F family protein n=1 Tax=Clostridium thailandense TaxID=2794346 RepID=UPI00398A499D